MTLFVPYDGTPMATAALREARSLSQQTDEQIVAATVIYHDRRAALEKGWIDHNEPFDLDQIIERLQQRVEEVAPDADYQADVVESHISPGGVARRLRDLAREVDPSIVVLGSENVTRSFRPVDSINGRVAARLDMDLYVVQTNADDGDSLTEQSQSRQDHTPSRRERTGSSAPSL